MKIPSSSSSSSSSSSHDLSHQGMRYWLDVPMREVTFFVPWTNKAPTFSGPGLWFFSLLLMPHEFVWELGTSNLGSNACVLMKLAPYGVCIIFRSQIYHWAEPENLVRIRKKQSKLPGWLVNYFSVTKKWVFLNMDPKVIHNYSETPCFNINMFHQFFFLCFFPESVWAQGSSNSGGLSNIISSSHLLIFTSSHPHTLTSSHPHIFTSSHLLILTSSHLHILTSSHLLIFTSSHLHICSSSIFSSSHFLIFTSSHLHIFSFSDLIIFASSHLHIFSSSHHIFTSSQLIIFTSSHLHIFSSSHHVFTSSHPHIFTSSHLHTFTFSLALLLSCPLALLPPLALSFFSISLLKARGSANETARNATFSHEMRFDRQKLT